jgi:hypothetical protein
LSLPPVCSPHIAVALEGHRDRIEVDLARKTKLCARRAIFLERSSLKFGCVLFASHPHSTLTRAAADSTPAASVPAVTATTATRQYREKLRRISPTMFGPIRRFDIGRLGV